MQQEYAIAWVLVFLIFFLALLVVCIPRSRAVDLASGDKRGKEAARRKKKGDRIKKKNMRLKQKELEKKMKGKKRN